MLTLQLYTTEHCSLCEQALDMLLSMPELAGHTLRVVDIADSQELVEAYGELIPVISFDGEELCAPFDRAAVLAWLDAIVRRAQA